MTQDPSQPPQPQWDAQQGRWVLPGQPQPQYTSQQPYGQPGAYGYGQPGGPMPGQPYGQPSGQWPPQAPPPPRKTRKWPFVVGGFFVLLVIIGSFNNDRSSSQTSSPSRYPTSAVPYASPYPSYSAAPTTTTQSGPRTSFSNGTYLVGSEVQPGRYRTSGASPDALFQFCMASRQRADGQGIGFPETTNDGPAYVTIQSSDAQVEFTGPCTWVKS
jgi:hypothetical protein